MTTLEVMRKALEALRDTLEFLNHHSKYWNTGTEHPALVAERGRDTITALRAEIERLEAAEPVSGWKLVPVEPTLEMLVAAGREDDAAFAGGSTHGARPEDLWAAMLDAAPSPPAAIPALTMDELERQVPPQLYTDDDRGAFMSGARWAYALAAERAGARIKE